MSPTRTPWPAFTSSPFTVTRPASHVSFASVRRRITRLHFKKRSRRIGSTWRIRSRGWRGSRGHPCDPRHPRLYDPELVFRYGFVCLLGGAGIDVAFGCADEAVSAHLCEVFPHLWPDGLLPENIKNFFLGEFEREGAAIVFVIEFDDHEGVLNRNDIADLTLLELVGDG